VLKNTSDFDAKIIKKEPEKGPKRETRWSQNGSQSHAFPEEGPRERWDPQKLDFGMYF
jgi:hypothetical protein